MKKRRLPVLLLFALFLAACMQGGLISILLPGIAPRTLILFALLSGLLCVAVVLVCLALWSRRDKQLLRTLQALHGNDVLDLSVEFPAGSLGSQSWMEASLNAFTYALNSIFLDIVSATRKFNLFSADIYFSSRQLSEQSKQQAERMSSILDKAAGFRNNLGVLSTDLEGLLQDLDKSAALYNELDSTNLEAKRQLLPLVTDLEAVREQALSGRQRMDSSLDALEQLTGMIADLHHKIDHMNSQTQQIGRVLSGIQDIADRTHVLATNASIEAARVGKAGLGFRVIAGEVRTLASNSREAILEVEAFLRASSDDTKAGARLSGACAQKAAELKQLSDNSAQVFRQIDDGVGRISTEMTAYTNVFNRQHTVLSAVLQASTSFNAAIERFNGEIHAQISGYTQIHADVEGAAQGALAAEHAAQVLSQLGTYLKLGGQELNHIVAACKSSEVRLLRHLKRKEKRRVMLYNLEVLDGPRVIGHLGDISPSGLLLYCDEQPSIGQSRTVHIRLPLSYGELPEIELTIIPRRIEAEASYYRVGCSLESVDSHRLAQIEMIITNYTVDQGLDHALTGRPAEVSGLDSDHAEELEEL